MKCAPTGNKTLPFVAQNRSVALLENLKYAQVCEVPVNSTEKRGWSLKLMSRFTQFKLRDRDMNR